MPLYKNHEVCDAGLYHMTRTDDPKENDDDPLEEYGCLCSVIQHTDGKFYLIDDTEHETPICDFDDECRWELLVSDYRE